MASSTPPGRSGDRTTTPAENKALFGQIIDRLLNHADEDFAREHMAADLCLHFHVQREPFRGLEPLFYIVRAARNGFSDFRMDPKVFVAEDDQVVVHGTLSGTHDGRWTADQIPGSEPMPESGLQRVPPTGRRFEIDWFARATFADGKVVDLVSLPDAGEIPLQLGILGSRDLPLPLVLVVRAKLALARLSRRGNG